MIRWTSYDRRAKEAKPYCWSPYTQTTGRRWCPSASKLLIVFQRAGGRANACKRNTMKSDHNNNSFTVKYWIACNCIICNNRWLCDRLRFHSTAIVRSICVGYWTHHHSFIQSYLLKHWKSVGCRGAFANYYASAVVWQYRSVWGETVMIGVRIICDDCMFLSVGNEVTNL